MKKSFILLVLILGTSVYAAAAERPLLIVGESFPPFEYEENGKAIGIDVDIITHIFQKMNIKFEIQILPWKRAWQNIENGKADASLSTSRKEQRIPFLYYPEEDMWMSEYVFFTQGSMKHPVSIGYEKAKADNLTIGVIGGNSYHDSFWETFPYKYDGSLNDQLKEAYDVETNFHMLANGRINLYIIDKIIGMYTAKMMKLGDQVTCSDQVLFSKGYPMPFAKKSDYPNIKQIADTFEKELKALKKSGKYNEILEKWLK